MVVRAGWTSAHLRSRLLTLWTNSYFAATIGGATLEAIQHYVDNQRNA
jgi:putative transposase